MLNNIFLFSVLPTKESSKESKKKSNYSERLKMCANFFLIRSDNLIKKSSGGFK